MSVRHRTTVSVDVEVDTTDVLHSLSDTELRALCQERRIVLVEAGERVIAADDLDEILWRLGRHETDFAFVLLERTLGRAFAGMLTGQRARS